MFKPDNLSGVKLPDHLNRHQKINQSLYDRKTIPAAAPGKYIYYQGSQGRSRLYTNFDTQNMLDNPRNFLCAGLKFVPAKAASVADIDVLADRAYFTFTIGDKPFLELPLSLLLFRQEATQLNGQGFDAIYKLDNPILLPSQQVFRPSVDIEAPAVLSAPVDLMLVLDGILMRPPQ